MCNLCFNVNTYREKKKGSPGDFECFWIWIITYHNEEKTKRHTYILSFSHGRITLHYIFEIWNGHCVTLGEHGAINFGRQTWRTLHWMLTNHSLPINFTVHWQRQQQMFEYFHLVAELEHFERWFYLRWTFLIFSWCETSIVVPYSALNLLSAIFICLNTESEQLSLPFFCHDPQHLIQTQKAPYERHKALN